MRGTREGRRGEVGQFLAMEWGRGNGSGGFKIPLPSLRRILRSLRCPFRLSASSRSQPIRLHRRDDTGTQRKPCCVDRLIHRSGESSETEKSAKISGSTPDPVGGASCSLLPLRRILLSLRCKRIGWERLDAPKRRGHRRDGRIRRRAGRGILKPPDPFPRPHSIAKNCSTSLAGASPSASKLAAYIRLHRLAQD